MHFNTDAFQSSGNSPNELQYIKLKVIDQKKCTRMVMISNVPVSDTNICTLNRYGEGACHVCIFELFSIMLLKKRLINI